MDNDERAFRVGEDVLASLPELGIMGLFGFVIYSNFKSGSTTTDSGSNPIFKTVPQPGLGTISPADLQAIAKALGVGAADVQNFIVSIAAKTQRDVVTVAGWLKGLLGL